MPAPSLSHRALGAACWTLALLQAACTPAEAPKPRQGPPARIVSQAIVADEILWDLGEEVRGRVVAVSKFADEPRYGARAPWPDGIVRLGPHGEQLIALEPDLVIAASFSSPELRDFLERTGIPTLVLADFTGFEDYRRSVRHIGDAVGAPEKAEALVASFFDALAQRSAHSRSHSNEGRTVVSWISGMVAGSETTFDDAARAAGFSNSATPDVVGHKRVPLERVISWDPDYIVTACGVAGCEAAVDRLREQPAVSATRAARSGHIHALSDRVLYATGTGMLDLVSALVEMAEESP